MIGVVIYTRFSSALGCLIVVNLTGSLGHKLEGVNMTIVYVPGIPDFLPDLTGVGVGLKLCFLSIEVYRRSFENVGMFRDMLYLPEFPGITAGVFKKELIMCFR